MPDVDFSDSDTRSRGLYALSPGPLSPPPNARDLAPAAGENDTSVAASVMGGHAMVASPHDLGLPRSGKLTTVLPRGRQSSESSRGGLSVFLVHKLSRKGRFDFARTRPPGWRRSKLPFSQHAFGDPAIAAGLRGTF